MVVDGLNKIFKKTYSLKLIEGLKGAPSTTYNNLQYTDNTLIFGVDNIKHVVIMKWKLCCFEAWSRPLKIFYKSPLVLMGEKIVSLKLITQIFGCTKTSFPIKYSGIPLTPGIFWTRLITNTGFVGEKVRRVERKIITGRRKDNVVEFSIDSHLALLYVLFCSSKMDEGKN